jgi:hypothetical protein
MEHQSDVFEKMTGSLEDRFDFLNAVAGTLTAKAYRALDVTTNQEVTVWRTRGPLQGAEVTQGAQENVFTWGPREVKTPEAMEG